MAPTPKPKEVPVWGSSPQAAQLYGMSESAFAVVARKLPVGAQRREGSTLLFDLAVVADIARADGVQAGRRVAPSPGTLDW